MPWFALLLAACATTRPPLTELDDAAALVSRAREAGAAAHAPVEMRFAEDKLERARTAAAAEDYATATVLAEQAAVDAELARVKSRQTQAREAARAKAEENVRLRRELLGEGPGR